MALVIENPETIERIARRAAATGKTVDEVIAQALDAEGTIRHSGPLTGERKTAAMRALRELREHYQLHRDPNDHRTADEIIGYDEFGLPS